MHVFRLALFSLVLSLGLLNSPVARANGGKYALVIANAEYSSSITGRLDGPVGDAVRITRALTARGFTNPAGEIHRRDKDVSGMRQAIKQFADNLGPDDDAVVYFVGHGFSYQGDSYLMGTYSDLPEGSSAATLAKGSYALSDLLNDLLGAGPASLAVIINACRTPAGDIAKLTFNTNSPKRISDLPTAAEMRLPETVSRARDTDVMIVFSAAPGQEALDTLGDTDPRDLKDPEDQQRIGTVFGRALAESLVEPDLTLGEAINRTQVETARLAKLYRPKNAPPLDQPYQQTVWVVDAAKSDLCYAGKFPCDGQCSALFSAGEYLLKRPETADTGIKAMDVFDRMCSERFRATQAGQRLLNRSKTLVSQSLVDQNKIMPITRSRMLSGTRFSHCQGVCPLMVVIEGRDDFRLAKLANNNQNLEWSRELSIPNIAVSETEITVGQYSAFVSATGYKASSECKQVDLHSGRWTEVRSDDRSELLNFNQDEAHPVVCLTMSDMVEYVNWLNSKRPAGDEGQYRLISEAEWELVMDRALSVVPGREDPENVCRLGNFYDKSARQRFGVEGNIPCDDGNDGTSPATYGTPYLGIYGLQGNVAERTADCWNDRREPEEIPDAGEPLRFSPDGTDCVSRAIKGTSWVDAEPEQRAYRRPVRDKSAYAMLGFRLVYRID